ncbi:4386_t:CDS:2, partial [Scutellospora calospora]
SNKEGKKRVEGSEEENNEDNKDSEEIKDYKEADKANDEDKLTILHRSSIIQFDMTQISGALILNIENNQNLNSEYNQDLLNQLMLLKYKPQIPQELRVSSFLKNNSLEQSDAIKKQLDTFFALMSTCYQTIFDVNNLAYQIEISRRMSLRFLYKFNLAYNYLKEWTMKFTSCDKGTKSATQVRALLIGKESPYNIFN